MAAFMRLVLLSCLVGSISLVLYSSSSTRSGNHWLRHPNISRNPKTLRENTVPTNISHIVFGIGGLATSWRDRSRYTSLWWDSNTTRGFAWLDKNPTNEIPWPENQIPYRVSENLIRLGYLNPKPAVRIARIVLESFRLGLPDVRWFVMGDDDTVYFTDNLVSVLARYDHDQMYYIGGNSESVEQNVMHSYDLAFGGGGFAVSYPLAAELVNLMDGCLKKYDHLYGSDERVCACITDIGVPLTKERGFHQFDIRGDPCGLLAAHPLVPLVSLHHLDFLNPIIPNRTKIESVKFLIQSHRADPLHTLQQSFCFDRKRKWSVSIAWGYSVQIYPSLMTAKALQTPIQTFKTWRSWSEGPFTFNTRPVNSNPCENPVFYFLNRVEEVGKSGTRSIYNRSVGKQRKICKGVDYNRVMAVQTITVSASKLGPDSWSKAPRRQCCEIMEHGVMEENNLKIRVRKCRSGETVST